MTGVREQAKIETRNIKKQIPTTRVNKEIVGYFILSMREIQSIFDPLMGKLPNVQILTFLLGSLATWQEVLPPPEHIFRYFLCPAYRLLPDR